LVIRDRFNNGRCGLPSTPICIYTALRFAGLVSLHLNDVTWEVVYDISSMASMVTMLCGPPQHMYIYRSSICLVSSSHYAYTDI
jgi:hypothetical protein